jgi:hypothetical protein
LCGRFCYNKSKIISRIYLYKLSRWKLFKLLLAKIMFAVSLGFAESEFLFMALLFPFLVEPWLIYGISLCCVFVAMSPHVGRLCFTPGPTSLDGSRATQTSFRVFPFMEISDFSQQHVSCRFHFYAIGRGINISDRFWFRARGRAQSIFGRREGFLSTWSTFFLVSFSLFAFEISRAIFTIHELPSCNRFSIVSFRTASNEQVNKHSATQRKGKESKSLLVITQTSALDSNPLLRVSWFSRTIIEKTNFIELLQSI